MQNKKLGAGVQKRAGVVLFSAWADPAVFNDGRWSFETDAERTIHYIAGGSFLATGDGFEVVQEV